MTKAQADWVYLLGLPVILPILIGSTILLTMSKNAQTALKDWSDFVKDRSKDNA